MSVEAKALFLRGLEEQLRTRTSASEMSQMLGIIADQLGGFDMQRIQTEQIEADELMNAYVSALNIQGRSEKTIERYRYIIRKMMDAIQLPTRKITVYHLRTYLAKEKERGLADETLEGMRQIISAYFNWLKRESLIDQNPVANLGTIKVRKRIRDAYSEVDLEKLKANTKCLRDKAIVCFLSSTACRINEMIQLNRDDIDLENLECTVLGKGNKERTVFLDPVAGMVIQQYLESRDDRCEALFTSKYGAVKRITAGGVRNMLKTLGRNAEVNHVHPHKFRRTKATSLIKHGMPIQEVADILGHDKLDTTMKYVVMDRTDVRNSYQKYSR